MSSVGVTVIGVREGEVITTYIPDSNNIESYSALEEINDLVKGYWINGYNVQIHHW